MCVYERERALVCVSDSVCKCVVVYLCVCDSVCVCVSECVRERAPYRPAAAWAFMWRAHLLYLLKACHLTAGLSDNVSA